MKASNHSDDIERKSLGWLESLLIFALVTLALQLFPSVFSFLLTALDIRNWSSAGWFAFFAIVCLLLCSLEYGSSAFVDFQTRISQWLISRRGENLNRELARKRESLKQERALYERLKAARKRQIW